MNKPFITKLQVREIAEGYGCTTRMDFDSTPKTMYIQGFRAEDCIKSIENLDGVIPFKLVAVNAPSLDPQLN